MNGKKPREKLMKGPLVLYEQMRRKVLELIDERNLKPHDPVPSEGELADMFGVSRRTSKQALEMLAQEGVVYRMPRRGTFLADHPHAPGTDSRGGKVSSLKSAAIVVPMLDEYTGQVVSSAVRHALSRQMELTLRITGGSQEEEDAIMKDLAEARRTEGIIFFPGDRKTCGHEVLKLHLNRYPLVLVDRVFKEISMSAVCHNHVKAAYDMTSYLIGQNHHRIGFISEPITGVVSREERYQGFVQAMLEHRLPFTTDWLFDEVAAETDGDDIYRIRPDVFDKIEHFIKDNRLTALFCANDHVAVTVLNVATKLGIEVPGKLSITGFTDLPFASQVHVPLTTVRKCAADLGKHAVDLLLRRLENREGEPELVSLETEIVVRESVVKREE
jgi:DNA-binding LacI/PurR family transcriptional regulator